MVATFETRLLIDYLKQNRPHIFPDRVVSSRTINDPGKAGPKPKTGASSYSFNLPVLYAGAENESRPPTITKRYTVLDEFEPSTFANLFVVS